jgi:hypothetical protein
MSYRFVIVGTTDADKLFGNLANVAIANAFRNMANHFQGVAVGAISEYVTLNSGPVVGTGTISIATGNMSDADTITINSVVLTAKTTPVLAGAFKIGSTALQTAINLRNLINSISTLNQIVRATYARGTVTSTGVVTVTALGAGTAGNYTWSQSGSNVTLSPASAMGSGANGPVAASATITSTGTASNGETMSLLNQTLTAKTSGAVAANGEFNISGTVGTQAANIAAAINKAVSAKALAGVVTVTASVPGTIGNGLQISESLTNVTATAFAGGTDALVQTFHKNL